MPELFGKTEEEARTEITNAGLTLENVRYEEDTTKTNGTVIKQSIDSGTEVEEGTAITITVNRIAEIKTGTVNIYVSEIVDYEPEKDENGVEVEPEKVKVIVSVEGESVPQYDKEIPADTEKITVSVKGIGNIRVMVNVDGNNAAYEMMDLNSDNPVLDVRQKI